MKRDTARTTRMTSRRIFVDKVPRIEAAMAPLLARRARLTGRGLRTGTWVAAYLAHFGERQEGIDSAIRTPVADEIRTLTDLVHDPELDRTAGWISHFR